MFLMVSYCGLRKNIGYECNEKCQLGFVPCRVNAAWHFTIFAWYIHFCSKQYPTIKPRTNIIYFSTRTNIDSKMVYINFPTNLTEEEQMLQAKYQKLKKKVRISVHEARNEIHFSIIYFFPRIQRKRLYKRIRRPNKKLINNWYQNVLWMHGMHAKWLANYSKVELSQQYKSHRWNKIRCHSNGRKDKSVSVSYPNRM